MRNSHQNANSGHLDLGCFVIFVFSHFQVSSKFYDTFVIMVKSKFYFKCWSNKIMAEEIYSLLPVLHQKCQLKIGGRVTQEVTEAAGPTTCVAGFPSPSRSYTSLWQTWKFHVEMAVVPSTDRWLDQSNGKREEPREGTMVSGRCSSVAHQIWWWASWINAWDTSRNGWGRF